MGDASKQVRRLGFGMPRTARAGLVWLTIVLIGLLAAMPAQAAFPGGNGKIAFSTGSGIDAVEPDGTGRATLVGDFAQDPAWSADGAKLAVVAFGPTPEIFTADADGSNLTQITNTHESERLPAWSPEGTRIVFNYGQCFMIKLRFRPEHGELRRHRKPELQPSRIGPGVVPDGRQDRLHG